MPSAIHVDPWLLEDSWVDFSVCEIDSLNVEIGGEAGKDVEP
jgi:hypothetical protein